MIHLLTKNIKPYSDVRKLKMPFQKLYKFSRFYQSKDFLKSQLCVNITKKGSLLLMISNPNR